MTAARVPNRPITLGELAAENNRLRVWCTSRQCHHFAEVPARRLVERIDPTTPINRLSRYLRCSQCNASGKETGAVYILPEQPPLGPMGLSRPD